MAYNNISNYKRFKIRLQIIIINIQVQRTKYLRRNPDNSNRPETNKKNPAIEKIGFIENYCTYILLKYRGQDIASSYRKLFL